MQRPNYSFKIIMLASLLSIALAGKIGLTTSALAEDSAAEALKKCDALASHPHDPNRFAVGVSDEQFAPGAAIEACEPAVKLNPELARVWFEMDAPIGSGSAIRRRLARSSRQPNAITPPP